MYLAVLLAGLLIMPSGFGVQAKPTTQRKRPVPRTAAFAILVSDAAGAQVPNVLGRPDSFKNHINGTLFYVFNIRKKPLDDVRVRRALSLVLDRDKIVKYILSGGGTPAARLNPPLYPGYEVK